MTINTPRLVDKIGQFTTIPTTVINLWPQIGMDAFALFVCLRYHSDDKGKSFPAYTTIKAETTLTRNKIAKAIRVLETFGLLERRRRFGSSSIYILTMPSISHATGLMENDTVVPQQDYSSPVAGLSVVPQRDTNQINLTKLNKLEEEEATESAIKVADVHPATAEKLFQEVTGLFVIPSSERRESDIKIVQGLIKEKGYDVAKTVMEAAWKWWTSAKGKNGRPYDRANTAWLDKAMSGQVPVCASEQETVRKNADGSFYA